MWGGDETPPPPQRLPLPNSMCPVIPKSRKIYVQMKLQGSPSSSNSIVQGVMKALVIGTSSPPQKLKKPKKHAHLWGNPIFCVFFVFF